MRNKIPVGSASLGFNECFKAISSILTSKVSGNGKFNFELEHLISDFTGCRNVTLTSSGTSALHLLLKAYNIGPGDEVIVSPLTFVATGNAVLYCGAVPRFADVNQKTWNIDLENIRKVVTTKTRAIILTHLFGNPCDLSSVIEFGRQNKIIVIEDAAEALGALYDNQHVGINSDGAMLSFYGNKLITTGEGGAVFSRNREVIQKIISLKSHAQIFQDKFNHHELAYNYRLSDLLAAIGVAQFRKINSFLSKRKKIALKYSNSLSHSELATQHILGNAKSSYWLFGFLTCNYTERINLTEYLCKAGIETRPFFKPLNTLKYFSSNDECSTAQSLWERGICIPLYPKLKSKTQNYIVKQILGFYGK